MEEDIKNKIEFYKKKMEKASIEDRLWSYEPKIVQLEEELKHLSK